MYGFERSSVGRKPRRAEDATITLGRIAPGLSRAVRLSSSKIALNLDAWFASVEGERHTQGRGSNPAREDQVRNNALGAPRFSPYRP